MVNVKILITVYFCFIFKDYFIDSDLDPKHVNIYSVIKVVLS